jgi:hypothetical protein
MKPTFHIACALCPFPLPWLQDLAAKVEALDVNGPMLSRCYVMATNHGLEVCVEFSNPAYPDLITHGLLHQWGRLDEDPGIVADVVRAYLIDLMGRYLTRLVSVTWPTPPGVR